MRVKGWTLYSRCIAWRLHGFCWLLLSLVQTLSVSLSKTDGPQRLSLTVFSHSLPVLLSSRWIMHWPTPAVLETLCSYQEYTLPSKRVFISVCLWIFLLDTITLEHLYHKTNIVVCCLCVDRRVSFSMFCRRKHVWISGCSTIPRRQQSMSR